MFTEAAFEETLPKTEGEKAREREKKRRVAGRGVGVEWGVEEVSSLSNSTDLLLLSFTVLYVHRNHNKVY